jgi:hypothetical protein
MFVVYKCAIKSLYYWKHRAERFLRWRTHTYSSDAWKSIRCRLKTYCHVYEWLWTGFGLVIGFIEHLQIRDYKLL